MSLCDYKCPCCGEPLRFVQTAATGGMFSVWCSSGRCKSRQAVKGAIAGTLEFAVRMLGERVEEELSDPDNEP